MNMRRAVYPGSFDPVHYGHIDIVTRTARVFDEVIAAVYDTPPKQMLFSVEERVAILERVFSDLPNVKVAHYSGLTVDYMREVDAFVMIRGLRVFSDFEFEFRMALANRRLAPDVEVVNFMADEKNLFISSSTVREIASLGGDVSSMVPHAVAEALRAKFNDKDRDGADTNYVVSLQD